MLKTYSTLIIILTFTAACGSTNPSNNKSSITDSIENDTGSTDESDLYANMDVKLLITGGLHNEEADPKWENEEWWGVFVDGKSTWLAPTKVFIKKTHDPVVDDEGEETGWDITTSVDKDALLLFSGIPGLKERNIDRFGSDLRLRIDPTKKLNIVLDNQEELMLSGKGKKDTTDNFTTYIDYVLQVTTKKGKKKISQDVVVMKYP